MMKVEYEVTTPREFQGPMPTISCSRPDKDEDGKPVERTSVISSWTDLEGLNRSSSARKEGGGWFWEDGVITISSKTFVSCADDPSMWAEDERMTEYLDASLPWDPTMELVSDEDGRPKSEVVPHGKLAARLADEVERSLGERPSGDDWEKAVRTFIADATEMAKKARIDAVLEDLLRVASPEEVLDAVQRATTKPVMES